MAEPQEKITHAEIVEIFGNEMPIEAVSILKDESITPNEARERLRSMAAGKTMAGDIEITDEMVDVAKGAARAKAALSYASSDECWRFALEAVYPIIAKAAKAEAREALLAQEIDDDEIVKLLREHLKSQYDVLTYEKSPPMFPQATYDSPTYGLRAFVKAIRAAAIRSMGV